MGDDMNILQFINDNWTADNETKLRYLDDFCKAYGMSFTLISDKKAFVNKRIIAMIKEPVHSYRRIIKEKERDSQEIIYEKIDL